MWCCRISILAHRRSTASRTIRCNSRGQARQSTVHVLIQGTVHVKVGGLLPPAGRAARFAQVYCLDTDAQDDERARWWEELRQKRGVSLTTSDVGDVLKTIADCLHIVNPYSSLLQRCGDMLYGASPAVTLGLTLEGKTDGAEGHAGVYNKPSASIVGQIVTEDHLLPSGRQRVSHVVQPNPSVDRDASAPDEDDVSRHHRRMLTLLHHAHSPPPYLQRVDYLVCDAGTPCAPPMASLRVRGLVTHSV